MEKYSKHLEVLVAERTQDLMHEKQRTDRLLYSMSVAPVDHVGAGVQHEGVRHVSAAGMLPKQVADDLRQGKPLQAQSYISATVFFRYFSVPAQHLRVRLTADLHPCVYLCVHARAAIL